MDGYCERLGPGLFAEPLNAVSNVAFLIASAILITRLLRRPGSGSAEAWSLPVLLGVVGLCSLSFHTFATLATEALDTLSIVVFILVAVLLLTRRCLRVRAGRAWLATPAFLVLAGVLEAAIGGPLGGYLPALIALIGYAIALRSRRLAVAAAVFAVALTLRTLDEPLCGALPIGTHWLWHCLNAVVLFLVATRVDEDVREPNLALT